MVLVNSLGAFVLAYGWWVIKEFSTRFLRNWIRVGITAIVVMGVTIVASSIERSSLESLETPIFLQS